jgi:hypothetical protein
MCVVQSKKVYTFQPTHDLLNKINSTHKVEEIMQKKMVLFLVIGRVEFLKKIQDQDFVSI